MDRPRSPEEIAQELERRVEALRASARNVAADAEDLAPHVAAIEHLAEYAALLRASGDSGSRSSALDVAAGRYLLKLELPDGRWDLVEAELRAPPPVGAVIDVSSTRWRVRRSELVETKPPGKPPRELWVCAPAA